MKSASAHEVAIGLEKRIYYPSKLDGAFLIAQHCRRPSLHRHLYSVPIGNGERNTLGVSKRWNGRPCKCTRAAHSSGQSGASISLNPQSLRRDVRELSDCWRRSEYSKREDERACEIDLRFRENLQRIQITSEL